MHECNIDNIVYALFAVLHMNCSSLHPLVVGEPSFVNTHEMDSWHVRSLGGPGPPGPPLQFKLYSDRDSWSAQSPTRRTRTRSQGSKCQPPLKSGWQCKPEWPAPA